MKRELVPLRVEFVCWANICRSPFAAAYARAQADPDLAIFTSSGLRAGTGNPMDAAMSRQLHLLGVTDAQQCSARTSRATVYSADLIITMEAAQRQFILDEWPTAVRKVFTLGQFAQLMAGRSARFTSRDVIAWGFERRVIATESLDVADPFRRGEQAAVRAAEKIVGLVDATLAGLQLLPPPRRAAYG